MHWFSFLRSAFGAVLLFAVLASCSAPPRGPMVAIANTHAARAAMTILKQGGSAMDAAITAQLVLTLVEPQSSGIGGGAYLLYWDEGTRKISAYDGRETAPSAATPALFTGADGKPLGFFDAMVGGRAVGAPGVIAMMWHAHKAHGRLAWPKLFAPAIALAERGFKVSPLLHQRITAHAKYLTDPSVRNYFFIPDPARPGQDMPLPAGFLRTNPAYAATLRKIAGRGPDAFYKGDIARAIIAAVRGHKNKGGLSARDLAGYMPKIKKPLCAPYRHYRVCGMPPSTSGGVTVLQILGLLEGFDMSRIEPGTPEAVHLITEASKLAYADRGRYLADPDFVDVPVPGLIDQAYLKRRAALIDAGKAARAVSPGTPPGAASWRWAEGRTLAQPSTTHYSIIDADGNAVSITSSVEAAFGAHIMAAGFLLNNQLTDFSFRPERDGRPVANQPAGGKRPRSSMSPTLVFDKKGDLFAAIGSPGGSRIIAYVAQTLIALLDWNMTMQDAIALPRHVSRDGPIEIEHNTALVPLAGKLKALGHEVQIKRLVSGLHGIRITADGLDGGADPRREGVVLGNPR